MLTITHDAGVAITSLTNQRGVADSGGLRIHTRNEPDDLGRQPMELSLADCPVTPTDRRWHVPLRLTGHNPTTPHEIHRNVDRALVRSSKSGMDCCSLLPTRERADQPVRSP